MKHRLKQFVRSAYANTLFYTGLHRLVDRVMPRRLTVLCGHCVHVPEINGDLPSDMRVSRAKLEEMLGWFAKRYRMCTLSEGLDALEEGAGPSLVALTMDDGYRDNAEVLPEILKATGARATVFLESRALAERRLNWSHKFFSLVDRLGAETVGKRLLERAEDAEFRSNLEAALARTERLDYHVKRVLKYDVEPAVRDPLVDAIFVEDGGDERALCEQLYMDWDGARALLSHEIELGGHTVRHPVLSTLGPEAQREEIGGGRQGLEEGAGASLRAFAYPFGRRWDFDEHSVEAVRAAGFESAVTTHAGTIDAKSDRMRLARLTFDETTSLPVLVAEACGGFDLLRRFGLDLSQ